MTSQQIAENMAVESLAKTLRHFVDKGKVDYVHALTEIADDKGEMSLQDLITLILKDATEELVRGEMIHFPTKSDRKEINKLVKRSRKNVAKALLTLSK